MIELKLSQARPGHGGVLPAAKVSAEIAAARRRRPGRGLHLGRPPFRLLDANPNVGVHRRAAAVVGRQADRVRTLCRPCLGVSCHMRGRVTSSSLSCRGGIHQRRRAIVIAIAMSIPASISVASAQTNRSSDRTLCLSLSRIQQLIGDGGGRRAVGLESCTNRADERGDTLQPFAAKPSCGCAIPGSGPDGPVIAAAPAAQNCAKPSLALGARTRPSRKKALLHAHFLRGHFKLGVNVATHPF
jgi:Conserved region in glutamate synthase